ncbi:centromere-associated protein E [Elgaria multicarinata webbii]|uniref:centromere-associated protein E n=1 Tax=Elgaria multicarinata webbii TaxID=159646 RepID=UPI002FCD23EE
MVEEGGVTVCVRVRPLIARENEDLEDKVQVSWKSEGCTISQIDGTKSFIFDRVFHSQDGTMEVYQGVAAPIIKSAVQGYNGTIFAYGQTASGKTYTMLGTQDHPGILPMAINDVFNTICRIPDREFLLRISYMEIHNESIQDLLCSNIRKKKPLVVREDINRTIYVEDLSEEVVISPEQVLSWLQKGEKNRHYGETKMNERSSRSHTIFRMIIESKEKTDTTSSSYEGAVMVSHLNLVDLAGSERVSQTGAEGIRFKEGCNINRSLFILGQVIKKLCDDQSGGYISYRDSKLTRILQNSLGGNAKTVIICTVTPVSLEETLSTLQFASTAKKMKNTPKVNEVLDDEALLKRYRKEIEDLKRRLEEVSSHSHTKDQLAQLLEEKNSLQKQQQDRIRSLTEMLVTASSFLQERELKARRKRRVTWAPGALSQDGAICFREDFPSRAKHFKASVSSIAEMEESVSSEFSEYDDQSVTARVSVTEEEWIPASEINFCQKDFAESVQLCETLVEERDNAVTEQQAAKAKLESLQLEKEQLVCELSELRDKMSTYEFVALEKETAKEQEMQLIHEISSLKALIANAEVYNQDLQEEINSKDMQMKEQENKIQMLENRVSELQNLVEELKTESGKRDMSFSQTSSKGLDEMRRMKQSLDDAEVVALDAKKESSFLRSENLALKEKMSQLSETYSQMEKDVECYRSQLEAGKAIYKKMQSDLQKELQYYFQENAKLTSLLEGKAPKDLLSCMELEKKVEGFKNDLNKSLEENAALRKEVEALSEAASRHDLEIIQKELLEKSETIASLTSERERLLSQVAEKERMLHEATDVLKSKEDLANAGAVSENAAAFQELKHQCDELTQKFLTATEESDWMKGQVDFLSGENLKLNATISDMTQEVSGKIKELQEKDLEQETFHFLGLKEQLDEAHQKLNEMEPLKDQLKAWESKLEAAESEKLALAQRLQEGQEEIGTLTQERDDVKQKQEALEQERDQIKEDIQETVSMNIEAQEELRNAHDSLKQCQNHIKELEDALAERDSQIVGVRESLGITIDEQKQQLTLKMQELQDKESELEELLGMKEQLREAQWKRSVAQQLEEELKARESKLEAEKAEKLEMAQRLRDSEEERKGLAQERDALKAKWEAQTETLKGLEEETTSKIQQLEEKAFDLLQRLELREEQSQQDAIRLNEMEQQKVTFESKMAAMQREQADMVGKLHNTEEDFRSVSQENEHLKTLLDALQAEKDNMIQSIHRLSETVERTVAANLELQEQLRHANRSVKEHKEMVEELKEQIESKDSSTSEVQEALMQKDTKAEMEKLLERVKDLEEQVEIKMNLVVEKDQLFEQLKEKHVEEIEQLKEESKKSSEELNLQIGERNRLLAEQRGQIENMKQLAKENSLLQQERDDLQQAMQNTTTENDQLRKNLLENSMKRSETNAKVEQQDLTGSLEAKVLRITEALEKFPVLEKRSEHFKNMALQIKSDLDSQKVIVAKGLAGLPPQQASNVKRLQMEHELISNGVHSLLNKVQFLFSRLCKKEGEFFTSVTNYTRELLQEGRKQHELLTQIQHLKRRPLEQHGDGAHLLNLPGLSQNLDVCIEHILKDVSNMEEELLSIEEKLQQLGSDAEEARRYLERCSVHFDEQDFEAGIKQDNERLLPVGRFLKPKAQVYIQARSELETRNAEYCRETEAALEACREQTKELLLELNTLEEKQKPCGLANLALEEENYQLGNKLKATEQDRQNLKLRIQELENVSNEAGRNLQEKEKRIAILEMELKVRSSRSEVAKLQAALDEKENCLRQALSERQTLKAQLDKGAALYKEEIEDLKTQIAKTDMARMKQSKFFDQEMATAKALAEYRDEQLRKLKEELRKVQQEQDVTVISGRGLPQTSLPITCGGGSGIVQNTQVLVLKSEHAKLETNYKQLKKDHELLLANELVLKEELKKWKERALKRRDKSSRDIGEEQRLRSPRKTAPPSFSDVPCSPYKESALKPVLPLDTPPPLPLNCPTSFFDNSRLGTFADTRSTVAESTENDLKHWMATANKGDVPNCKTQ